MKLHKKSGKKDDNAMKNHAFFQSFDFSGKDADHNSNRFSEPYFASFALFIVERNVLERMLITERNKLYFKIINLRIPQR